MYFILLSCTEDDAFRIGHSVKEGNGLEAMRLLMMRYEPRTPGTKRALLKAIINNPVSKKPDELAKNLMKVEEYMKHYEAMGDLNNTVHEKSDPNELTITIDSGASENVISEEFAPQVMVRAFHVQPR